MGQEKRKQPVQSHPFSFMSTLFIIRHGLRLDHEDSSWKKEAPRPFDSPLSTNGKDQAQATGEYLQPEGLEAIYASPLLRTVQTGHAIAEALDLPLFLEAGLVEWLNPSWYDFSAGWLPPHDLKDEYPRLQADQSGLVWPQYPEIEKNIVKARVEFVARQLAARHDRPIALITHGICVQSVVERLTDGRDQANGSTCAIHVLQQNGSSWKLAKVVVSHLQEWEKSTSFI